MNFKNRNRFILIVLETRLDQDFSPALIQETLTLQPLPELQSMLNHYSFEAIAYLKALKYQISEEAYHRACQHNYSDLFRMRDRLQLIQSSEIFANLNDQAIAFYSMLGISIGLVINHLESLGICSLGPAELLPDYFRESRQEIMRQQTNIFQARCKSKAVDAELSALLLDFFHRSCARDNFTQKELHYSEHLMTALQNFLNKQREGEADVPLMYKLLRMNYNCPALYKFFIRRMGDKLEGYEGTKRKRMALIFHCKELKQMLPVEGMALHPALPELKSLLLDFMQEEICYLEKANTEEEERGQAPGKTASRTIRANEDLKKDKIQLQFSQRILAIWTQSMISKDLIILGSGGQKAFSRFLADNFTTIGKEQIDPDNIRRRYKEKHAPASEALVGILEGMIGHIKEEYMELNMPKINK